MQQFHIYRINSPTASLWLECSTQMNHFLHSQNINFTHNLNLKETLSDVFLFFLSSLPPFLPSFLLLFPFVLFLCGFFLPLYLVVSLCFHPHDSSLHLIPVFLCFPLSFHFLYSSPFFFLPSFPPVSSPHFSSFPCFLASKFDSITFQFHFPSPCSCLSEVLYYSFQGQSEGIGMEIDTEWGSGKSEEGGKIDGKRGNESWKKNEEECGQMMDTLFFWLLIHVLCLQQTDMDLLPPVQLNNNRYWWNIVKTR